MEKIAHEESPNAEHYEAAERKASVALNIVENPLQVSLSSVFDVSGSNTPSVGRLKKLSPMHKHLLSQAACLNMQRCLDRLHLLLASQMIFGR